MNQLIKLSRADIEQRYINKPILIKCHNSKIWYIVSEVFSQMPLHMLDKNESDLFDQDPNNINGIQLSGVDGDGYLMWIYLENKDGWEAYGYE